MTTQILWTTHNQFHPYPFELEKDLEAAILQVQETLFGRNRIYLDVKKKIGAKGRKQNIPDGYLLDLTSRREPKLYVVENELSVHDPLRHIAVQILEFSLSFETSPHRVKEIVKQALIDHPTGKALATSYAVENGFENIDFLLETVILKRGDFNALIIIDELVDDLEKVLRDRFKFPVEILTIGRFKSADRQIIYQFEPFLSDVTDSQQPAKTQPIDPSDLDTVVVPAREEGFYETFMGENMWHAIRIHASMLSKIKYLATYQVAPISAITHIAKVADIQPWKDTNKFALYFDGQPEKIKPIKLIPKGAVKAPQAPRYTAKYKLDTAETLDDAF